MSTLLLQQCWASCRVVELQLHIVLLSVAVEIVCLMVFLRTLHLHSKVVNSLSGKEVIASEGVDLSDTTPRKRCRGLQVDVKYKWFLDSV